MNRIGIGKEQKLKKINTQKTRNIREKKIKNNMMMENLTADNLMKNQMLKFMQTVIVFCKDKKIKPSLKNFLLYKTKENQYLPDSFNHLLNKPCWQILGNSKTFINFYNSLDRDIQNTITSNSGTQRIKQAQMTALLNKDRKQLIQKILKQDYVFN